MSYAACSSRASRIFDTPTQALACQGVTFRRRESDTFWRMLRHSVRVHIRLYREFPRLKEEYRAHMGDLTSPQSWSKAFTGELRGD